MELDFETIACPFCGSEKDNEFLKANDRLNPNGDREFRLVICSKCNFIFLNPRPTRATISAFYEREGYQPFLSTLSNPGLLDQVYDLARRFAIRSKRHTIEKLMPPGKLLDVGCGTGEFLFEMQRHGWQVEGLETDERAAEFARDRYQLKILSDDLQRCNFSSSQFDVITLWHVLEHLYAPLTALKKVRNLLTDNGFILIAAPNVASFDARFYKANWVALDAPRHLQHFTPETMAAFCGAAGLKIKKFAQVVLDAFYNPLMSDLLSAKKRGASAVMSLLYVKRSFLVALISLVKASRLQKQEKRLGSSILYYIQKV
ncbi:MAG: class I SAM-dependent methyltransferase [bacterium]